MCGFGKKACVKRLETSNKSTHFYLKNHSNLQLGIANKYILSEYDFKIQDSLSDTELFDSRETSPIPHNMFKIKEVVKTD